MKRSKPETDKGGTKRWKNAKGQLHREDGPAMEWADGSRFYYINDQLHREDGPAMEWADGGKSYYINGQRHREDGPAVEWVSGRKSYYIDGQLHREDGPAIEYADGSRFYCINGKKLTEDEFMKRSKPEIARDGTKRWKNAKGQYHREDGPAIECADGGKHYYVNGQLHREDGPAMEWVDGSKFYYIGGQRHREDGPAVEWVSGRKDYYINGKKLTEDEFMKKNKSLIKQIEINEDSFIDTTKRNEDKEMSELRATAFGYVTAKNVKRIVALRAELLERTDTVVHEVSMIRRGAKIDTELKAKYVRIFTVERIMLVIMSVVILFLLIT